MNWHLDGKGGEESGIDVAIGRSKACHIQSKFRRKLIGRQQYSMRNVKKKKEKKKEHIV